MSDQSYSARHRERVYDGFVKLDVWDATVCRGGHKIEVVREVHDHGHGAAVLPYDAARRTALLVRQMRMPVHVAEGDGMMLEAAAGLTDPGDAGPEATALREGAEELGYRVRDLEKVATFYPLCGLVTEQMTCFLAAYTPDDRIAAAPDVDEDEVIDVEEWPLAELWRAFEDGRLKDGKAIVLLQALRLKRPDLFSASAAANAAS